MKKLAILVAAAIATSSAALAQYPEKPITIIVPSKAGGGTDTTARVFIETAEKTWPDAEFVVKNVPGSGGQKGFEEIAAADDDGYTIGMVFTTQLASHIVAGRSRYTLDSFHVLGNAAEDPSIVVVPKDSPINNLSDLAEAAKNGDLTIAVNGIGSDDFIAANNFTELADVEFSLLPTNGSTEQKAGILGGHFDAAFMNLSQMLSQHEAGEAKIISILTEERHESAAEIETGKEQGFDLLMTATRGFVAPANVNDEAKTALDDLFANVLNDEGFLTKAKESYIFTAPMTGPDYRAYLDGLKTEIEAIYEKSPW